MNAKLTDTVFLKKICNYAMLLALTEWGGSIEEAKDKKTLPTEEEVRVKMISQVKVKTIEEFLSDPAGFLAFKTFLQTSNMGMEFMEYLLFWEAVWFSEHLGVWLLKVEVYKENPSTDYAKSIYNKFLVDDTGSHQSLIQVGQC